MKLRSKGTNVKEPLSRLETLLARAKTKKREDQLEARLTRSAKKREEWANRFPLLRSWDLTYARQLQRHVKKIVSEHRAWVDILGIEEG